MTATEVLAEMDAILSAQEAEATCSVFTWTTERDHHAPKANPVRYVLRNPSFGKGSLSPLCADDRLATCSYDRFSKNRQWEARFYVGYDSISATGGTAKAAMARLQAEIDRRSIGLFDLDDISFIHA